MGSAPRSCRLTSVAARKRTITYAAQAPDPNKSSQMLVIVPPHVLVKHNLAIARNKDTPSGAFRAAIGELGKILIYEAVRDWLPTVDLQIETPVGVADATVVDPTKPVALVPILRAGLVPLEQASSVIPVSITYHVGYVRDEETLEASLYLNKLPPSFTPEDQIIVSDPMLATGGTMIACLKDLVSRGASVQNIRVISIVAAPPALTKLGDEFPGLKVYTAMIDPELNDVGYIIPGLGDAGDRAFGTV
ncbi:hypothetical protein CYMTET_37198 [Cymbomonas tetramitiformis]|uniref:uracil phosphoribosyltransferase n=1 Tax=Cymbomonas tetramitiformis TaxID=36881 RepID=A0AAE0CGS6_9CHLO|nr:hypothetical protein CYMTET_37198 [Cymbomonas tetramitiformis]